MIVRRTKHHGPIKAQGNAQGNAQGRTPSGRRAPKGTRKWKDQELLNRTCLVCGEAFDAAERDQWTCRPCGKVVQERLRDAQRDPEPEPAASAPRGRPKGARQGGQDELDEAESGRTAARLDLRRFRHGDLRVRWFGGLWA